MEGAIVVVTRHVVVGSDAGLLIQEWTLGRTLSGRISTEAKGKSGASQWYYITMYR